MKVLITGITGFAGSYLAEYILEKDLSISIVGLTRKNSNMDNIAHIKNNLLLVECDIQNKIEITDLLAKIQPDYIFHLAAQSKVSISWDFPSLTLSDNILGELNIFETVKQNGLSSRILIAASGEEYGRSLDDQSSLDENQPFSPNSSYAVSKIGQDLLGFQYFANYGMHIIRTRAFNHSGPRRGDQFVESSFAKQLAEISLHLKEPIVLVGNLSARRDFTDVRDVVRGYWLALEYGTPGEVYNICSGKTYSIKEILDKLINIAGVNVTIKDDAARLRPVDSPVIFGNSTKFFNKTGWKPEILLDKTLSDIYQYWKEQLTIKI